MKKGMAGSLESNDALIIVTEHNSLEINIESIVFEFYGEEIYKVVESTVLELGYQNLKIDVTDKGALDYTIRARLITAIKRMEENDA